MMKSFPLWANWALPAVLLGAACTVPAPSESRNPPAVPDVTARPSPRGYWECVQGLAACDDDPADWLARIEVPPGFSVTHVGQLPSELAPTSIAYGPDNRLYVAAIPRPFVEDFSGGVYVFNGETFEPLALGFMLPIGLAFEPGGLNLYVSSRAGRFEGKISLVEPDGSVHDVITGLPCCYTGMEHQPNGLAFGPDGFLYVAVGARTDHGEALWERPAGEVDPLEAAIVRLAPDGSEAAAYARGLRNPYDLDFDLLGQLWTDDNGPDFGLPDRVILVEENAHYGFPYYGVEACETCLSAPADLVISPPYVNLPPHSAPAGLAVYTGAQYPINYLNSILVALWNPGPGGKIIRIYGDRQVDDFVTGLWTPVDVVVTPAGSVAVADYLTGHVFEIRWGGF